MSLAACCTLTVPCPSPAPDADVGAAADLLFRCQRTNEDLGKLVREEHDLLFNLSLQLDRLRGAPRESPPSAAQQSAEASRTTETSRGSPSKDSNIYPRSPVDAGGERKASREVRFGRGGYGPPAVEIPPLPPPLMMLPTKPAAIVENMRPVQPSQASSPPKNRKMFRGDLSKGTAASRFTNDNVSNVYSINGISKQPIQFIRNSFVEFIRSNFSAVERQDTRCGRMIARFIMFCVWLTELKEPERTGCLASVVRSPCFSLASTMVILANAVFILYATDYEMENLSDPTNTQIRSVDACLAGIYVAEVLLKLIVHKLFFFWNSEWRWNLFDFLLVVFAVVENILANDWLYPAQDTSVNLIFLRLFRLCKIVKSFRLFRTLKFFSELRLMLDCMIGSVLNVIWCVMVLFFVMYIFALFVQQLLASYLVEDGGRKNPEDVQLIYGYFGSVGQTLITLFQASTSGVDWRDPYNVLAVSGPVLPAAFLFYVAFVFISVWNIITSTFVEKALKLGLPDIDLLVMEQQLQDYEDAQMLAQLFGQMLHTDEDGLQRVGLEEFRHLVENSEFLLYLQTRGIDIKNAETFFKMLVELHGEPTIDATTFANACVRMKGAATSIDLQTVMYTTHLLNKDQRRAFQFMYSRLKSIEGMLRGTPAEDDWPDTSPVPTPKSHLSRQWTPSSGLGPVT